MELKGKRVLVTGAGGFVGSHLVEHLAAYGCQVRCFIHYNAENRIGLLRELPADLQAGLEIVMGDLLDPEALRAAAQDVAAIFHLGALIAIPYSYRNPRDVFQTNVMGTFNVMVAARDLGIPRVVHTSTSEVYGTARFVPITEEHPLQGQSPYSASKIGADKVAESFHASYGLPVVTVRPFNIYGPRQSARAVIPTIITQALTGDTVHLGALTPTRDFTFVHNTVEGFIRAAEADAALGGVFNLGSSFEISIGDLARKIIQLTGRDVTLIADEDERLRPGKSEVQRLWADSTRARDVLGWTPRVGFEDGLQRTIDWIGAHLDLYRSGYTI